MLAWVRTLHLLGAATWTGGLITLAVLVVALRSAGAERPLLQASARAFARLSWVALAVAVGTGISQVDLLGMLWTHRPLQIKVALVLGTAGVAAIHQFTARRSSPAIRGALQLVLLGLSVGIFVAAVHLRPH